MVRQTGRVRPSFDMVESKRAADFVNQTATTNNTVTRLVAGGFLAGDNRSSFLLDWIKLDWGFDFITDGAAVVLFLVREPVGGAALDALEELQNHVVWWDAKYVKNASSVGFQILSDSETFVNFLPDEEFEIGDGDQLSLYAYTASGAGTNNIDWNIMAKFRIVRKQVTYPNDNAYFDCTYEESVQWSLDY